MATCLWRPRRRAAAFTLIELVVVIVVIALLLGLAAFAYTKFVAGSRETAARSVAVQVAKSIQGHSANHQLPYGEPVYGDGGSHPAPSVVAADLTAGEVVSGMSDETDPDTGEQVSTITVTRDGYTFPIVFATGQVGTPGKVPGTGTPATGGGGPGGEAGGLVAPTNVRVDQPLGTEAVLTWNGSPGATGYTISASGSDLWTGTGTAATLDTLPAGAYTVTVTATNGTETAASAPVAFTIYGFNDNRADAWPITAPGPVAQWTTGDATNAGATKESGERYGTGVEASVWWKFTAPVDGTYTFETLAPAGAAEPVARHQLMVLNTATDISLSNPSEMAPPAIARVHLDAGQEVHVRVSSLTGTGRVDGAFRLRVSRGPTNDDREDAPALAVPDLVGSRTTENFTNLYAGMHSDPYASGFDASVWWTFTAPMAGTYTFETLAPTGGAAPLGRHNVNVIRADTSISLGNRSEYEFPTTVSVHLDVDQEVHVRVTSLTGTGRSDGAFRLRVSRGPTNDDLGNAPTLPVPDSVSSRVTENYTNLYAGMESGEKYASGLAASVWWKFTAPSDGTYTFETLGPAGDATPLGSHNLNVIRSDTSISLANRSEATFPATVGVHLDAGQQVDVRVASLTNVSRVDGAFRLRVSRGPMNDDRDHAVDLPVPGPVGSRTTETFTNLYAGMYSEPHTSGLDASVWWKFTAPSDGTYTFETLAPSGATEPVGRHQIMVIDGETNISLANRSEATFPATVGVHLVAGQQVDVRVASLTGAGRVDGAFRLRVARGPTNDDRSRAYMLPAPAVGAAHTTDDFTNLYAGLEGGEVHATGRDASVWWTFTAPSDDTYTFETLTPSGSAPVLGRHSLQIVQFDGAVSLANHSAAALPATVTLHLDVGQQVHVRVASLTGAGRVDGAFRLRVSR